MIFVTPYGWTQKGLQSAETLLNKGWICRCFSDKVDNGKRSQLAKIRGGTQHGAVVNWSITLLVSIVYRSEAMGWFIVLTRVSAAPTIDAHIELLSFAAWDDISSC